jgi:PAS domain S-box-containing protein
LKVRRLMYSGMALALALVVVHQVVVEMLERQYERIDAVQLAVGKVSRNAAGLLVLTQDYLLYGHSRARRQWHAVHAEVAQTLRALGDPGVELKDDIKDLADVTDGLPPLFTALASSAGAGAAGDETADARRQMLSDHLVAETRRISDGAFDLASRLIELRTEQQRRLRFATLAANASLAMLLAGLVAVVMRRVLRPMRRLQDTARRIEAGDLQARSAYPAPDEFGSLSQSFDAMTQALQDRQAALEATRRDLRTVFDAVPSMIGYWDRNLDNRVANLAYHTWFGADLGALTGRNLRDLLGPTLFEADRPHIEAALRGEPQTFESSIPLPDGKGPRHLLAHYLPDRQGDEVKGFYVIVHDVTELNEGRLQLAAALAENEALLGALQQYALFSEMGPDGRFIKVNDNVCQLTGFSREELLGQTFAVHQPQLASGDFDSEIWPALSAGRAWQGEIGGVAKDGRLYWTYAVMVPVKAADGSIGKYVSIRTDITTEKRLAQEAQRSKERFELAASAAGIGVWDYDVVAGTLVWDDQMYALYGCHRSGGLEPYALWSDSVHSEDRANSEKALQDAIAGLADFEPEFRIVRPDSEVRHIKAMARVVRDADGRPLRVIGVNFDVTGRRKAEAALQANESLLRRVGRMALVGGWRTDVGHGHPVLCAREPTYHHRGRKPGHHHRSRLGLGVAPSHLHRPIDLGAGDG